MNLFRLKKLTLILFFWCSGFTSLFAGAQLSTSDSLLYQHLLEKVEQHCYNHLDSTFYYLDSIENFVCRHEWWSAYVDMLSWKAFATNQHKKLELSYDYLKQAEQAILMYQEDLGDAFTDTWQDNQSRLSNYYYEIGYFSKTLDYAQHIIQDLLRQDSLDNHDFRQLIISHLFVGTAYKNQGNYEAAIENFLYCINYEKERAAKENRSPSYKSTLYRLAEVYRLKGDFVRSRNYYLEALPAMLQQFDKKDPAAQRYGDYIISYYHGLAQLYEDHKMLDSATYYLEQSLPFHQPDAPNFMNTYHYLGEILMAQQDFDQAAFYLNKALDLKKKYLGKGKNHQIARTYQALGKLEQHQQHWQTAMMYYDLAINYLTDTDPCPNHSKQANLSFHQLYAPKDVLSILTDQIATLYQSQIAHKDTSILKIALEKTKTALHLMDNMRFQYSTDEDKQFLNEKSYIVFERGIDIAYQLGENYLPFAFLLAEKSKATVLYEAMNKAYLESEHEDSEILIHQQYQLKYRIGQLKDQREQAIAENASPEFIQQLQLEQFKLNRQYEQLLAQIKSATADLFCKNEPTEHLTVAAVQQELLNADQTLIEYFIGTESLYIFTMTTETLEVKTVALDFPLVTWAIQFKEDILYHENELYVETAHQLYQKLLAPIRPSLLKKNLIIIPDGVLGYIPFEALLTQQTKVSKNYKNYPYLLKNHAISYCFSASLLQTMQQLKTVKRNHKVLAFAPSFRTMNPANPSPLALRNALTPLTQNIPEAENICQLTGGHLYAGTEATLDNFLKLAPNFRVLHLASHGKTKANTNYSYIAFSNWVDTTQNDYKLYVKDLYRMRWSADLVVLSACETGLGTVQQGEGILSLARGFSYAGTKSIITTLWNIDDYSTKTLMVGFYQYMQAGKTKDEALRLAKLDYLEQSGRTDAHPAYWAAFVAIGDMNSIDLTSPTPWSWWMSGFLAVLAVLALFRYSYFNKSLNNFFLSKNTLFRV